MVLAVNQENEILTIRLTVLSYITMISFLLMNVSKQLLICLIKNILKRVWCFHGLYKIKPEIEGNVCYDVIDRRSMDTVRVLVKIAYFSDLYILGNISDKVNKIYNIILVVFGYFSLKILHIVLLNLSFWVFFLFPHQINMLTGHFTATIWQYIKVWKWFLTITSRIENVNQWYIHSPFCIISAFFCLFVCLFLR